MTIGKITTTPVDTEKNKKQLADLLKDSTDLPFNIAFKKSTDMYIFMFDDERIRNTYKNIFHQLLIDCETNDIIIGNKQYELFISVEQVEMIDTIIKEYSAKPSKLLFAPKYTFTRYLTKKNLAKERSVLLKTLVNLLKAPAFKINATINTKPLKLENYIFVFDDVIVIDKYIEIFDKLDITYAVKYYTSKAQKSKIPNNEGSGTMTILPDQMNKILHMTAQYSDTLDDFKKKLYHSYFFNDFKDNTNPPKIVNAEYEKSKQNTKEVWKKHYKSPKYICIPNLNGEFSSQIECEENAIINPLTDWDRKYLKYKMKYLNLKLLDK